MSEVNNLISEALKSGLTMDDILADFSKSDNPEEKAWHDKWKATSGAPEYQPGAGMKNQASTIWPENWDRIPDQVPYEIPAALAAVGLGVYGAKTETGQKIISSLKNRMFGPSTPPDMPGTGLNLPAVSEGATPAPSLIPNTATPEQIRIEKQRAAQAMIEGRPVVAGTGPVTQSVIDNISPVPETFTPEKVPTTEQETQKIVEQGKIKTGKAGGSISPIDATIESNVITGKQVSDVTEKAGKAPPVKRKKEPIPAYKSEADIPKGMVFRTDVGNLDRSLVNILGPEHRLHAKELLNEGKMFGQSKNVNEDVSRITKEYFQKLQGEIPETLLGRDARRMQGVESKMGTYGSVLGKPAKVAGVLGTLMTVAQSANAREAAQAIGESLLPIGITPSEVQSGKLTAKQLKAFEEAQKLGSPYRSVPPPR